MMGHFLKMLKKKYILMYHSINKTANWFIKKMAQHLFFTMLRHSIIDCAIFMPLAALNTSQLLQYAIHDLDEDLGKY